MSRTGSLNRMSHWIGIGIFGLLAGAMSFSAGAKSPAVMGVFEGITPCSGQDRPLPQIPADSDCEQMIWKITFYEAAAADEPGVYMLEAAYGLSLSNTTGLTPDHTRLELAGTWAILTGAAHDPTAPVYQLNFDTPGTAAYFVKMDNNLLHVLAPDLHMLVGNGGWSYTLNRTDGYIETIPVETTAEATPAELDDVLTIEKFQGRTPCIDLTYTFTKFPRSAACIKIKWVLTLERDPLTGEPATYTFRGTQTTRTGTWTETPGTPAYPNGMVYRLALDTPGEFTSFLRADANHLFLLDEALHLVVGDAIWSYTLSRET